MLIMECKQIYSGVISFHASFAVREARNTHANTYMSREDILVLN